MSVSTIILVARYPTLKGNFESTHLLFLMPFQIAIVNPQFLFRAVPFYDVHQHQI